MRKVLLATTALVALGGVSVANAADISISGNVELEYTQSDAGAAFTQDGHINVNASTTTDTGLTYSAVQGISTGNAGGAAADGAPAVDYAYITISSADIGTIYIGDADDDAPGMMDGALGRNNDVETQISTAGASTETTNALSDLTWISPSLSGLTIGLSKDLDDGAGEGETSFALKYSIGGVSLYYGRAGDDQSMAASGKVADFTIAMGSKTTDNSVAKANDFAVKYALPNGIALSYFMASGTTAASAKVKDTNVGASYALADGVTLKAEAGDADGNDYTWLSINLSY